ncbi:MAG: hypothetical protein CO189_00255 [candidate division Zixibacteria bacterium CG_4_9_14_3_um_filter_46_8]|nr:MAG: hypothetical protein CO189_00255 [candidate division Zixibacteria bacterium CG_4_9_14_3_um_filter_46_8]
MRALVLSGGGAKGCFQVGALDYLINTKNLSFDLICGVSVGALNGAMIAQSDFELLKQVWLNITSARDTYRKRWGFILGIGHILGALLGKDSLYDNTPLKNLIDRYIDQAKIISSGRRLRVGAVSLYDGAIHSIPESHPNLKMAILASTAIPLAFSPINISDDLMSMVDGGVRDVTPLKEAIDLGADEIYVILCSPSELKKTKRDYANSLEIVLRTLDILTNEIYRNDIRTCLRYNSRPDKRTIDLKIIQPQVEVCDTLEFKPDVLRAGMKMGYQRAQSVL